VVDDIEDVIGAVVVDVVAALPQEKQTTSAFLWKFTCKENTKNWVT
jgi:hypothetical protein